MMAQNVTRFTLVLVSLGVVLAIAVFRPPLLPSIQDLPTQPASHAESVEPEPAPSPDMKTIESPPASLEDHPRADNGGKRGRDPATWEAMLLKWEDELREWAADLAEQKAAIQAQLESLGNREAALRAKGADLAEREQRVQRLYRFSLVALIMSSLISVPSVVLLVVLIRQGRQAPDKEGKQARPSQPPQAGQWGQIARPKMAPHGNNGRSKAAVGYRL
ncbi:MAG: hypothetical protein ACE5OS_10290 [Anaerolineae bacterium]